MIFHYFEKKTVSCIIAVAVPIQSLVLDEVFFRELPLTAPAMQVLNYIESIRAFE